MDKNHITLTQSQNITTIRLNRGITNPINLQLVEELTRAVRHIRDDTDSRGLLLTGSNDKFFSIGFDIPSLINLSRAEFQIFFRSYNQLCMELFTLKKPTIAALTGHAIAGGCILALCCDYRFLAEGKKLIGVNEIKLGVLIPWPGDRILRALTGYRNGRDIIESGDFYLPQDALKLGLVDEVLPLEALMNAANQKITSKTKMPGEAFSQIKSDRINNIMIEINAGLDDSEARFYGCWFSDETQAVLREAAQKF